MAITVTTTTTMTILWKLIKKYCMYNITRTIISFAAFSAAAAAEPIRYRAITFIQVVRFH